MAALRVDTTNFVNTHGRVPRGEGAWSFSLGRVGGSWTDIYTNGVCSYVEARQWALASAKQIGGVDRVVLNP